MWIIDTFIWNDKTIVYQGLGIRQSMYRTDVRCLHCEFICMNSKHDDISFLKFCLTNQKLW